MASLEIEEILGSPDRRLRIQISFTSVDTSNLQRGGSNVNIIGYNQSGFSVSVANEYNNPLESSIVNALDSQLKLGQGSASIFGKKINTPITLKTALSTINTWVGSQRPQFDVSFYLISYKKDFDILQKIRQLNELFYPGEAIEVANTPTLVAPGGYGVNFGSALRGNANIKVQGTVALDIGLWFRAINLNPVNMSYELSVETVESGAPLYARVNVSFTPYKILSIKDINTYIRSI